MKKEEDKNLEYLGKVFKGLPTERKDELLHTARQLLEIQDNDDLPLVTEKLVQRNEAEFQVINGEKTMMKRVVDRPP